jgi:hypothetical protein
MKGVFYTFSSCSGDSHFDLIAVFTTEEKAKAYVEKLNAFAKANPKKFQSDCEFVIWDYTPPEVDPEEIGL